MARVEVSTGEQALMDWAKAGWDPVIGSTDAQSSMLSLLGEGSSEEQAEMEVVSAHFTNIIINIIIMSHDS